jgi:hypothetical protein
LINFVKDLLANGGFRTGVVLGLGACIAVVIGTAGRRGLVPWIGVAWTVAAVVGFADRFSVEAGFVVGLAVLALGCFLARRRGWWIRLAAVVPGALVFGLVGRPDVDAPAWTTGAILIVTVGGGLLMARFDEVYAPSGLPPVLLLVTVLGVYATTPDTEHAAILVGVSVPLVLLGGPWPVASLGFGGSVLVAAVLAWTVVVDGLARPGAVVGGMACLGLLVLEPAVRWASGRWDVARIWRSGERLTWPEPTAAASDRSWLLVVLVLHLGVVGACSRVAGLRTSAVQALALTVVTYAFAAALALLAPLTRRRSLFKVDK